MLLMGETVNDPIMIEPAGPQRGPFAVWCLAQDPPIQTASATGHLVPLDLYPSVPSELLEGAYVDGYLYDRPDVQPKGDRPDVQPKGDRPDVQPKGDRPETPVAAPQAPETPVEATQAAPVVVPTRKRRAAKVEGP